jgi:hypothetical protein
MIKYRHYTENNQYEATVEIVRFDDEGEVLDFAGVLQKEAEGVLSGRVRPKVGMCVDVELQGDTLRATIIEALHPEFKAWCCQVCRGVNSNCRRCDGKGWDTSREPNGYGVYLYEAQFFTYKAFVLVCNEVWEEVVSEDLGEETYDA